MEQGQRARVTNPMVTGGTGIRIFFFFFVQTGIHISLYPYAPTQKATKYLADLNFHLSSFSQQCHVSKLLKCLMLAASKLPSCLYKPTKPTPNQTQHPNQITNIVTAIVVLVAKHCYCSYC